MKSYRILLAGLAAVVLLAFIVPSLGTTPGQRAVVTTKPAAVTTGWTTYHHDNSRNGYDASAPAFAGGPFSQWTKAVDRPILAEPLALNGRVYVATMGDSIYSFDAASGTQIWARTGAKALGTPSTAQFCGFNPGHIGITSTPVIDPAAGIIYAVGMTTVPSLKYQMYALNISNGTDVSGFPVDLTPTSFVPSDSNQRAALALANGHVYVAFGGFVGDCGPYHPWVMSVPVAGGAVDHVFQPQGAGQTGAGIWGPSGIAVDGSGNLFIATGNGKSAYGSTTFPCTNSMWDYGDGVFKLTPTLGPALPLPAANFWAPNNATTSWCDLHRTDTDIGSLGPNLLPGNTLFQTGKSGDGWLLNSASLGGFDGQQTQVQACAGSVFGGVAYYAGRVYLPCDGAGLVALSVDTTAHTISTPADWIQSVSPGPPIAAMGLIWTRNQSGSTVYGFDPATGSQRVSVPLSPAAGNHFSSIAEDGGWIFAPHGANITGLNFNASPCSNTTSARWFASCTFTQYQLTGNNGSTWADMDTANLSLTFTPAATGFAVISGNADLWTSSAGYNQDIGIGVSGGAFPTTTGQPEAWKESGGSTTFSPNAAFVQTVIPVVATIPYTVRLRWKASSPDPGTIWAGAGPIAGNFSPTRLTAMLVPTTPATVFSKSTTSQYSLGGSNGATWTDMDATNLTVAFTPPTGSWLALVSGNADLWTSSRGYNQDIGVTLTGTGYPTAAGQPEAWKESGGLAGTFSPNAAFVQTALPVVGGGTPYTARLQWKANQPDPGAIWAGAGPIGGKFSPTSISVVLVPNPAGAAVKNGTAQYSLANSNGATWQAISNPAFQLTLAPSVNSNYLLAANADLWTNVAGYNQDIGIMVSGGTFGAGTLVTWKESGGTGAFSPNAAFAFGDVALVGGTTYNAWLVWKTNGPAAGTAIYAGAGPVSGKYSPTSLTATLLN